MNDFFARQQAAQRNTARLLLLFGFAVMGVVLAVYLVAASLRVYLLVKEGNTGNFWHPELFGWCSGITLFVVGATSFWKMQELNDGGAGIAATLGAKLVPPSTDAPKERVLRNVVEEMAIASAVPVPDLYLLERELGINAFAAGRSADDAVICVTRGALELLTRDELQGVVAHEFSHILNGDVLLNIRLIGWLSGIEAVGQAGRIMLDGLRHSRGRGAGALALIGAALYAIGYIGYFFGQLIKSAVSRQREYLGDASAVQFTRNPGGLAGALKKIGGLTVGSRLNHPRAIEISHMFFGNGLQDAWLNALDSHPPLMERIRCLEPRFNGIFPQVKPLPAPEKAVYVQKRPKAAAQAAESALTGAAVAALLDTVGQPMQRHLEHAGQLLAELPPALLEATRTPLTACAVVYGLLLSGDPAQSELQEQLVARNDSPTAAEELRRLYPALLAVSPEIRLPLLDLSLPALRALSPEQFQRLKKTTEALAAADARMSLFEMTLRYLLLRHLEPRFAPSPSLPAQIYGIRGVQKECSCILTTLARVGHGEESGAADAFAKGAVLLDETKAEFTFLAASECNGGALQQAFNALARTSPQIKRRLLAACLECIVHDGMVKAAEIELFRAVADAIGCPVPPWLDVGRLAPAEESRTTPSRPAASSSGASAPGTPCT